MFCSLVILVLIPFDTVIELDTSPSEAVERTSNCKVHLSIAQSFHQPEVFEASTTSGICDRDGTPLRQSAHQLFINTLLQPLVIRCMDEEF